MQDGNNNEPGWVFKPGDLPGQNPAPQQPAPSLPDQQRVENSPAPSQSEALGSNQVPSPSEVSEQSPQLSPQPLYDDTYPHVEWTASEYIAHQKSAGWYGLLAISSIGIAAIVYFVTNGDIVSTVVVLVLGLLLGIFSARQPRELSYAIGNTGIHIGQKFYPYESFKTFSVVHDEGLGYVSLEPLRRFMPPLTIHYDPNDEDRIASTLAEYLPHEDHKPDLVDRITRRFRF